MRASSQNSGETESAGTQVGDTQTWLEGQGGSCPGWGPAPPESSALSGGKTAPQFPSLRHTLPGNLL